MIAMALSGFLLASAPSAPHPGPARVNACIACHENLTGKLSSVIDEWKASSHYENKVMCDGCHGGDPTVTRDEFPDDETLKARSHFKRDNQIFDFDQATGRFVPSARGRAISYFCGKCHDMIKEKHLGSPHGGLGAPSCLYCHGQGSHAIVKPTLAIIDGRPRSEQGRCSPCHRAATMETLARITTMLEGADASLAAAVEKYGLLRERGYKSLALDRMYQHSQDTISQLRQTFHSFNMREINDFVSAIKGNAELTEQTYAMIAQLEAVSLRQAFVGAGVVLLLLLFAALLLYYRRAVLGH